MFGELPKLFGRDFVIAYFVPSAAFFAATYVILTCFQIPTRPFMSDGRWIQDITAFGSATFVWAVTLLVLNGRLVRLVEGYWPFGLQQSLSFFEKKRYQKLCQHEREADKKAEECTAGALPQPLVDELTNIKGTKAQRFPDDESLILPTSFGNIVRAFEVYPRLVYGIDAIPGWYRLLAVVPQDYQNVMDSAKARVDLWLNILCLAAFVVIEFSGVAIWSRSITNLWPRKLCWLFPLLALVLAYIAYRFAISAAIEWGHWVKSAFDLFLPDLRRKLEFRTPRTNEQAKDMWTRFTLVTLYRDADEMPNKTGSPGEKDSKDRH
jgi:hypothetical protein